MSEPVTFTFPFRVLVEHALDSSDETQPEKLARQIADAVPPAFLRDCLAEALEGYVRVMMDRRRAGNPLVGWHCAPTAVLRAKTNGIRAAWLRDRVHVGNGTWKLLPDCTYTDLLFAALDRRRMTRLSREGANRFEALARVVRGRGAGTVGELPPSDLVTLAGLM